MENYEIRAKNEAQDKEINALKRTITRLTNALIKEGIKVPKTNWKEAKEEA